MSAIYKTDDLYGDCLVQPSKFLHNALSTKPAYGCTKTIACVVVDVAIQTLLSPITVIGCSIKACSIPHIREHNRKQEQDVIEKSIKWIGQKKPSKIILDSIEQPEIQSTSTQEELDYIILSATKETQRSVKEKISFLFAKRTQALNKVSNWTVHYNGRDGTLTITLFHDVIHAKKN